MLKAVIQRSFRIMRAIRLKSDLRRIQRYWTAKASGKRLLIEKDMERYLRRN